jgi:hypothetical protein
MVNADTDTPILVVYENGKVVSSQIEHVRILSQTSQYVQKMHTRQMLNRVTFQIESNKWYCVQAVRKDVYGVDMCAMHGDEIRLASRDKQELQIIETENVHTPPETKEKKKAKTKTKTKTPRSTPTPTPTVSNIKAVSTNTALDTGTDVTVDVDVDGDVDVDDAVATEKKTKAKAKRKRNTIPSSSTCEDGEHLSIATPEPNQFNVRFVRQEPVMIRSDNTEWAPVWAQKIEQCMLQLSEARSEIVSLKDRVHALEKTKHTLIDKSQKVLIQHSGNTQKGVCMVPKEEGLYVQDNVTYCGKNREYIRTDVLRDINMDSLYHGNFEKTQLTIFQNLVCVDHRGPSNGWIHYLTKNHNCVFCWRKSQGVPSTNRYMNGLVLCADCVVTKPNSKNNGKNCFVVSTNNLARVLNSQVVRDLTCTAKENQTKTYEKKGKKYVLPDIQTLFSKGGTWYGITTEADDSSHDSETSVFVAEEIRKSYANMIGVKKSLSAIMEEKRQRGDHVKVLNIRVRTSKKGNLCKQEYCILERAIKNWWIQVCNQEEISNMLEVFIGYKDQEITHRKELMLSMYQSSQLWEIYQDIQKLPLWNKRPNGWFVLPWEADPVKWRTSQYNVMNYYKDAIRARSTSRITQKRKAPPSSSSSLQNINIDIEDNDDHDLDLDHDQNVMDARRIKKAKHTRVTATAFKSTKLVRENNNDSEDGEEEAEWESSDEGGRTESSTRSGDSDSDSDADVSSRSGCESPIIPTSTTRRKLSLS